jgi:hypothetical protein
MGKGKKCPVCGSPMYAQDEKYEPHGTWVVYVCRNGECPRLKRSGYPEKEKVFEQK